MSIFGNCSSVFFPPPSSSSSSRYLLAVLMTLFVAASLLTTAVAILYDDDVMPPTRSGSDHWQVTTIGRLDAVKNEILHKLRMLRPPNMTSLMPAGGGGRPVLPAIPSLQHMMETTNNDVMARQIRRTDEDDYDDDELDRGTNVTTMVASHPG